MADIFLSYARGDREKAERLAEALEGQGWSVFWDLTVPAGETWDTYIGGELEKARCVVVAWSRAAVESVWVREEAREGRERKILVPAFFENVKPPFGFRGVQGPDLSSWDGGTEARVFRVLVQGVERILALRTRPVHQPQQTRFGTAETLDYGATEAEKKELHRRWKQQERERGKARAASAPPTWDEDEKLNRRVLIEGGEFLMGSPEGSGHKTDRPQHRVDLSSFYLQEHPVTNDEYQRFDSDHRFHQGEERQPVVNISWVDASAYADWLGGRLPTEAEWEYACRAATDTAYWSGDSEADLARVGWYEANSRGHVHSVCEKPASPWELYDMHGNVWEWVADWYGGYATWPQIDPKGPLGGKKRVFRGGSFGLGADWARSARRNWSHAEDRNATLGFRVAFDAAPSDEKD